MGGGSQTASLTPQDLKKMLEIYDKHTFVKADKTFADEVVNGKSSAHFSVVVDKQKLTAFLEELKAADISGVTLTDKDIEQVKEATADGTTYEVWIARDTHKFTKLKVVGDSNGQPVDITIAAAAQLPAFDKLERPASSRPVAELLSIMFGQSFTDELRAMQGLGL